MRLVASLAVLATAPAAVGAQATSGSAPTPQVEVTERFYRLEERSLDEVVETLNGMRLEQARGRLSQGLTEYRIVPEWRPAVAGGVCRVSGLTVQVRIRVTLPEWAALPRADEEERARWDRIFTAIRDHEYEHRDITIRAAEELAETLSRLEARGCASLRNAVTGSMSIADGHLADAHAELDRSTPSRLVIGT